MNKERNILEDTSKVTKLSSGLVDNSEVLKAHKESKNAQNEQFDGLVNLLKNAFDTNLYGTIEIKFEAGKVTIVRKTESIKL